MPQKPIFIFIDVSLLLEQNLLASYADSNSAPVFIYGYLLPIA